MTLPRLAVVMPAYNESEGIEGFIDEIREHLDGHAELVTIAVANDRSTDGTADAAAHAGADVRTQPRNRGHGPTALAAYRAGLDSGADVILHVDGDGQFAGPDFPRVLAALVDADADVVHGVRRGRSDPWYRRALSLSLRTIVRPYAGRAIPDINTPLRVYRSAVLCVLVDALDEDAQVPHVHFSLAEARAGLSVRYVPVRSLPRRGSEATGTMWGGSGTPRLPPPRLRAFARRALNELWRESLRRGAPMRAAAERLRQGSTERRRSGL